MSVEDEIYPTAHELERYGCQEDAIRVALAESQPGDTIAIHEVTCLYTKADGEAECTCTPLVFVVPRSAGAS